MRKLTLAAIFLAGCGVGTEVDDGAGTSRAILGTDSAQYNFELGPQGWKKQGGKITSIGTATAFVWAGNQSLAVNFNTAGSANTQQAYVPTTAQLAGKTITFHVYLPTGMKVSSIQVFAQENQSTGWRWNGNWQPLSNLRLGAWNTLTVTLPANAAPLQEMGVEFNLSAKWAGTAYVDSIDWPVDGAVDAGVDAGTPVVDAGTPVVDAGTPEVDAGTPVVDAGTPDIDAGTPVVDAGTPEVDAGSPVVDAGSPVVDAGTPVVDAGTPEVDAGTPVVDAGTPEVDAGTPVVDAGTPGSDAGTVGGDGGVMSIRFGGHGGYDGLWNNSPVDPNLRTVSGWFHLRITTVNQNRQEVAWSIENNPPSTNYHLMVTTWHGDQWESHDKLSGGGFLFAPVDLGWWFVAESNNTSGPRTTLYWKKAGAATLNKTTGNTHPYIAQALTRFLVGTDDATGQNEWMDGDLAGLKVWGAELSQAELEIEANHLNPVRTANLHAFYPLQDLATMRQDFSGNGRNLVDITDAGVWSVQPGPAVGW